MDSKQKKPPPKKIGKKQFRNYALLDGISVAEMTKEQLESQVQVLQQEAEREREERNYFQLERDRLQLLWEAGRWQLQEKDAHLQQKDSDADEVQLAHVAEIKLYKQKMKHVMFECQQQVSDAARDKMAERLELEEFQEKEIRSLEVEVNRLKDTILQLNIDHENAIVNQRLQHGEELCMLHEQYQHEIDVMKNMEVSEIGSIRNEFDLQRRQAIEAIEEKKDAHVHHLIQTHEELIQKMKNYYNDIIKNDVLLIKSLKERLHNIIVQETRLKEATEKEKESMAAKLLNLQKGQIKKSRSAEQGVSNSNTNGSVIRNLQRELKKLKSENDYLFMQILRLKEEKQNN